MPWSLVPDVAITDLPLPIWCLSNAQESYRYGDSNLPIFQPCLRKAARSPAPSDSYLPQSYLAKRCRSYAFAIGLRLSTFYTRWPRFRFVDDICGTVDLLARPTRSRRQIF